MNILEAEEMILKLNQEIHNQTDYNYAYLEICSIGDCMVIKFLGLVLWTSDCDSRLYIDEEEDVHESLYTYLRREINNEIARLREIEL
uniref:Uncharacterized protein n=1 Tax=viral metagenome TaxID=1070528 RepID=A0A6M3LEQ4_9ZZZZ